jgi:hypothetical protein
MRRSKLTPDRGHLGQIAKDDQGFGMLFGALLAFSAGARAPTPPSAGIDFEGGPRESGGQPVQPAAAQTAAQQADRDFLAARVRVKAGDASARPARPDARRGIRSARMSATGN